MRTLMIRNVQLTDAKAIRDISEVSFGYKTTETVTELQSAKLLEDAAHTVRNPETPPI